MSKKSKKKKKDKGKRVITLGASYYENENTGEAAQKPEVKGVMQKPVAPSGVDGLDDFGDAGE